MGVTQTCGLLRYDSWTSHGRKELPCGQFGGMKMCIRKQVTSNEKPLLAFVSR